jgi:hypothetical protein
MINTMPKTKRGNLELNSNIQSNIIMAVSESLLKTTQEGKQKKPCQNSPQPPMKKKPQLYKNPR